MSVLFRPPHISDWSNILKVADQSAPWARADNREWLHNRQHFDQTRFERRQYVVEESETGELIAYGALEGGAQPGVFRVFVVMSAQRLADGLGKVLYEQLVAQLGALEATKLWAREDERDPLIAFFQVQQFCETSRFLAPDGRNVVTLGRDV